MSELTKDFFAEQLHKLATKDDLKLLATKTDLEDLKTYTDEQTEKLTAMVAEGFEEIKTHLDVHDRVERLEELVNRRFSKIEEALHIKF